MFVVPRRQQSPCPAAASGQGFLLPCLASRHSGAAGMLCQEREGSEDSQQCSLAGLLPLLPCPDGQDQPHPQSLPELPGGPCCPTQQGYIRRTRRRTSLLLYTNRAGIRTQCCPGQEGGRQTEREGDIREVTQNRLQLYGRKQAATTTVRGEDSAVSHGCAQSTAHRDPPRHDNTVPVPRQPAQMVPLPHPKAGAHLGAHRRPLSHRAVPGSGCSPKSGKEGKDRDTRVREEERERGGAKLSLHKPLLPTAHSAHWDKWEPVQWAGAFLSHPRLQDTAPQPPRPWSPGVSSGPNSAAITWQEDIHRGVALGARQAPALAAAAVLQHVLHRGRAATWNQPRARPLSPQPAPRTLTARVGRGLHVRELPRPPQPH